jgi:hypothetical protein
MSAPYFGGIAWRRPSASQRYYSGISASELMSADGTVSSQLLADGDSIVLRVSGDLKILYGM